MVLQLLYFGSSTNFRFNSPGCFHVSSRIDITEKQRGGQGRHRQHPRADHTAVPVAPAAAAAHGPAFVRILKPGEGAADLAFSVLQQRCVSRSPPWQLKKTEKTSGVLRFGKVMLAIFSI